MRLGGESANADGVRLRPSSNARAKAITRMSGRDLGEGTPHCALLPRIDQPRALSGVSANGVTSIIEIFLGQSVRFGRQIQLQRIPGRR